jgi:hypothetical protein
VRFDLSNSGSRDDLVRDLHNKDLSFSPDFFKDKEAKGEKKAASALKNNLMRMRNSNQRSNKKDFKVQTESSDTQNLFLNE